MKAKVKATGRIIEVEKAMIGYVECEVVNINGFPMQNFYSESDLEFLPEESKEVTIEGWVCRNGCNGGIKDSILHLFLKGEPFPDNDTPERIGCVEMWKGANGLHLPSEMFPEVTWDSEPKRVKITITPIEE